MKKLLTLLLTLVMAVCLANLNCKYTKADENADSEKFNEPLYLSSGQFCKSGTTPLTPAELNQFGLEYDNTSGEYCFKKNLEINSTTSGIMVWDAGAKIKLSADLTINATTYGITGVTRNNYLGSINGNGNKLTITSGDNSIFFTLTSPHTLAFTNVIAKITATGNYSQAISDYVLSVTFDDDAELILSGKNNNYGAISIAEQPTSTPKTLKGSINADGLPLTDAVQWVANDPNTYAINDGGSWKPCKYLEINKKEQPVPPKPEPTPDPSPKDESCEKVIGPTWHWNNDKGICEDYGVVGTSTR